MLAQVLSPMREIFMEFCAPAFVWPSLCLCVRGVDQWMGDLSLSLCPSSKVKTSKKRFSKENTYLIFFMDFKKKCSQVSLA